MGGLPSKPEPEKFDGLQVIGAGLSRTGTNSRQIALQRLLGGPVQHCGTHIHSESDALAKGWTKALEAKNQGDKQRTLNLVHQICQGFVGVTDGPGYCFLDEMLELYPDAKVVLVRRDPERWAKSFDAVFSAASAWYIPVVTAIRPGTRWVMPIARLFQQWAERLRLEEGLGPEEPYRFGPGFFEAYNERVIDTVPEGRLLVMQLGEGWEPLCRFLGKPVPDEPFPRANDSASVNKFLIKMFTTLGLMWAGAFTVIGLAVHVGLKWVGKRHLQAELPLLNCLGVLNLLEWNQRDSTC